MYDDVFFNFGKTKGHTEICKQVRVCTIQHANTDYMYVHKCTLMLIFVVCGMRVLVHK